MVDGRLLWAVGVMVAIGAQPIGRGAPVQGDREGPLAFRQRGVGDTARLEGVVAEPVGGQFALVSATASRDALIRAHPHDVRIEFFLPVPGEAQIWVSEIDPVRTFRMTPKKKDWTAGWVAFGPWSLDLVNDLKIPHDNLAIVITQRGKPEDSGTLFPALILDGPAPQRIDSYEFVARSSYGLAPLTWWIFPAGAAGRMPIAKKTMDRLSAGQPLRILVDASNWPDGAYTLQFRGQWQDNGVARAVSKQYTFHHRGRRSQESPR